MRDRLQSVMAGIVLMTAGAAAGPMDAKTVVVAGFAQDTVRPDFAMVRIGVVSIDKATTSALDANNILMRKVLEAIKGEGVPDKDIQTSEFSISALHPPRKDQSYMEDEMVTTGYRVGNMMTVTVANLKIVGKVIDAATRAGANMSASVSFGIKDDKALHAKVLADAVKDARHNAEIMAAAEGAKVGKLIAVSNTAPVSPEWGNADIGRFPDKVAVTGSRLETVVISEGVVPISAQVMAIYALE